MSVKNCANVEVETRLGKDARFEDAPDISELTKKNITEEPKVPVVIRVPKKQRDVKISISARIDKATRDKVNDIIQAVKFFDPNSKLSFNEIINIALENYASQKENLEIRQKWEEIKKSVNK